VRIAPLTVETAGAWVRLFEACGSACFCRWWHHDRGKNDWLARCFHDPGRNRDEQLALVAAGAPEARGLLAMEQEEALGWMKLAPRGLLPKLRRQGPYRALDLGDDDGVWSIGCLLVRPDRRQQGVARSLVEAAPQAVRAWGGLAIEAYPHRVTHALHDEEAWMGPHALFRVTSGWQALHDVAPYPVVRLTL
jgi:GNAT superfamily N-acetyltransferase